MGLGCHKTWQENSWNSDGEPHGFMMPQGAAPRKHSLHAPIPHTGAWERLQDRNQKSRGAKP